MEKIHQRSLTIMLLWVSSLVVTIYMFSYRFIDVHIVPRWLSFTLLYALLFLLTSLYRLKRYGIDDIKIYVYVSIVAVSVIEAVKGVSEYFLYHHSIVGCFDNVAGYASMQCVGIAFLLHFCDKKYRTVTRIMTWSAILIVILSLVLSQSRTGVLVALVITMFFVVEASTPKIRRILICGCALLLIMVLLICLSIKTDSTEGRKFILCRSWEMIKDKPLFGFGYDGFKLHYMDYQADFFSSNQGSKHSMLADNVKHPLNEYVKIVIEYGFVGFLCIISGLSLLYWSINKKYGVIDFSMFLSLLSIALLALFSYPLQYPHTWLILTLPFFLAYVKSSNICRGYHHSLLASSLLAILVFSVRINKELQWGYLYHNHQNIEREELLLRYDKLYTYFRLNPYFLYNYAHILYQSQEYNRALLVANQCNEYWHDYNLEILRGDIYDSIGNKDYAISTFINASHMCPNRFMPLHKLFRMALKQRNYDLAKFYAKAVLSKPIKVDSAEIQFIRNECYNYYYHNKL